VPKIGALATPVASGDLTLAEPAGIASGDLMLACFAIRSNVGFTLPGDWNLVDQELTGDTDATNGIASAQMFWTVRGGSAPTLTFSRTGGNLGMGRIIAYTGGHASAPFDVSDSATANPASTVVAGRAHDRRSRGTARRHHVGRRQLPVFQLRRFHRPESGIRRHRHHYCAG
jgi:hypothetical protein